MFYCHDVFNGKHLENLRKESSASAIDLIAVLDTYLYSFAISAHTVKIWKIAQEAHLKVIYLNNVWLKTLMFLVL